MTAGWVLYEGDDSPESVDEARGYIRAHGLTRDDVKLVKREGQVLVIAIREVRV